MRSKSIFVLVLLVVSTSAAAYSGGTGEPNNPYKIATAEDLNDIGNHPEDFDDCFILVNNINMAGLAYTTALIAPDTDSSGGFQGTAFTGIFDGNDCNISSLTIIDTAGAGDGYLGLFGQIGENGEVKDLGIEDVSITIGNYYYSEYLGGLCGENYGTISNCYATGSVKGRTFSYYIGGLCGTNYGTIEKCSASCFVAGANYSKCLGGLCGENYGTIENCSASGSVRGTYKSNRIGSLCGENFGTINNCTASGSVYGNYNCTGLGGLCGVNGGTIENCYANSSVGGGGISSKLGGLCGWNNYGTIEKCYYNGSVTGGDGSNYLGGLCGGNNYGTIEKCEASGSVTGGDYSSCLGGLCGYNVGTINNCYSTGPVTGESKVGGMIGRNSQSIVSNCYSIGEVNGVSNVGGFTGEDSSGDYTASFWDMDVNPDLNGIGDGTSDPNVIGKTTDQMQTENTFTNVGWDFVEIWDIGENQTYPYLRVYPAGDLNHDGGVDFYDFAIVASHWLEGTEP